MKIIGHRGAKGLAPENSMAALKKALEHEVDEIEIDVRVTKDRIPVVIHNPFLTDAAGNKVLVKHETFDRLHAHNADLITLAAAIDFVDAKKRLRIEVKPHQPLQPIVDVVVAMLESGIVSESNLMLGSRHQPTLRLLHQKLPAIEKFVIEPWSGVRAHFRAKEVGTQQLHMRSWWLWRGFVRSMQRRGYKISAYTMNDRAKAKRWEPYLYGVITDVPDQFEKTNLTK